VSTPRKNRKNSSALVLVLYLVLGVSCLVWLAAYTFYFKERPEEAGRGGEALRDLTRELSSEEPPNGPGRAADDSGVSGGAASRSGGSEKPGGTSSGRAALPPAANPAGKKPLPAAAAHPSRPAAKGKIAVILDDAGYQNALLKTFLEFPGKLTISVLPGLPGSAEAARMISRARKQMMLHLPMEPSHGENPGPEAILTSLDDAAILRLTAKHLDSLPGISGVNNHMGSRATENQRVMRLVLGLLKERGLYFIDSRTTAHSAGPRTARELGLRCRERSVFLDNEQDEASIRKYFEAGKAIAADRGWAIMIGHVWCARLAALLPRLYEAARAEGYEFVFVSELFSGGRE
jgi:polysaccharide deacetylase 2 family uncharacterized protein YibQ